MKHSPDPSRPSVSISGMCYTQKSRIRDGHTVSARPWSLKGLTGVLENSVTGERCVASPLLRVLSAVQYLEWREKQYDLRVRVDVFGRESLEVPVVRGALTYIASADRVKNLNYAGKRLSWQILTCDALQCHCHGHLLDNPNCKQRE